jgi:hypothetical protein
MLSIPLRTLRALLPGVLLAACTPGAAVPTPSGPMPAVSPYDAAIEDAAVWRPEHVLHLNAAHPDSAGNLRVATFTGYPGYVAGQSQKVPVYVWVTLVPEVRDSCLTFTGDKKLGLEQLLGLPAGTNDTLMVELTVRAADVFRPVTDPRITTTYPCGDTIQAGCGTKFPGGVSPGHLEWMARTFADHWMIPGGYPWTRLGYTYNWRPGAPRYGASEYVIRKEAWVLVESVQGYRQYCTATS